MKVVITICVEGFKKSKKVKNHLKIIKMEKSTSTALGMLKSNKTVAQRAESYFKSIRRNIQRDVLDELIARKEKMEESKFELSDFALDTNLNAGLRRMTSEDCEARFKKLIDIDYQLVMLSLEIKVKQDSFNELFGETAELVIEAEVKTEV